MQGYSWIRRKTISVLVRVLSKLLGGDVMILTRTVGPATSPDREDLRRELQSKMYGDVGCGKCHGCLSKKARMN